MYKHLGWCECMFSVHPPTSPEATKWALRLHQSIWFCGVRDESWQSWRKRRLSKSNCSHCTLKNNCLGVLKTKDGLQHLILTVWLLLRPRTSHQNQNTLTDGLFITFDCWIKMGNEMHTNKPRWRWKEKVVTLRSDVYKNKSSTDG